ncbi:hypothetical protein V491_04121 [Pseudogymnoascus sp. VKM F-3775]|nr:hypothetical protein V491_04121 [Pseudogymnoascus sp. VKM F-3775]
MAGDSPHSTVSGDTKQVREERQQVLPALGQLVSLVFFWGDHITQDVSRGPFTNAEDWIRACLTLVLSDQGKILQTPDDEDDIKEAEDAKEIERLLKLLPSVLPSNTDTLELSILFHDDLSMQNILCDGDGKIMGIIDWECVSALPLWRACSLPEFLTGRERNDEPKRDHYAPDNSEDTLGLTREEEVVDNEGVNSLYWEHLLEYELTTLRSVFLEEMRNLTPKWIEEFKKAAVVKADFELAVQNCDNSWRTRMIRSWLDALERGENWDLRRGFLE